MNGRDDRGRGHSRRRGHGQGRGHGRDDRSQQIYNILDWSVCTLH